MQEFIRLKQNYGDLIFLHLAEIAVGNFSDEPVAVVDLKKVSDGTHDNNTGESHTLHHNEL